jgi:hypothetical protein
VPSLVELSRHGGEGLAIPVLSVGDSTGGPGAIRTCWAYESTLTQSPPGSEVRTIDYDACMTCSKRSVIDAADVAPFEGAMPHA